MDSSRALPAIVAAAALVLASHALLAAESAAKHSLKTRHRQGELTRVEIALQVGGDLKLVTDGKAKDLPMSVVANLKYDEQLLAMDAAGRAARALRYYDDTRAVIKVDKGGEKPTLDANRRLIAVDKTDKSAPLLYCPETPLGREELDLIDLPGNSLLVDRLLPPEPVAFGETWKLDSQTLSDLLVLDAVGWSDVTAVLGEVKQGVAEIAAAGSIQGAVGGVATEIELKAKYRFDLQLERVTYLALLIKEKRAVGHVGPGLDTVAKVLISIMPIGSSAHLTDAALAKVPRKTGPGLAELNYSAASGQYQFQHDRRWYLTSDDAKLTIFRLLDRGELVAQCNVSLLPGEKKTPVTLAEFQHDVERSLGKN